MCQSYIIVFQQVIRTIAPPSTYQVYHTDIVDGRNNLAGFLNETCKERIMARVTPALRSTGAGSCSKLETTVMVCDQDHTGEDA